MVGWPRRRGRRLVAGLLIGALVLGGGLAGAVAGGLLLHDTAKPSSLAAAVSEFRSGGTARPGGVYVYATRGGEWVKAIVSAHHVYPGETGVTAVRAGCGLRLQWQPLQGRSTAWTLCRTRLGLELRSSDEIHRFFGQDDRTTYTCAGAVLEPVGGQSGDRSFRCRSARDHEGGQVHVSGRGRLRIGGRSVPSLHVFTVGRVGGRDVGRETIEWWLEPKSGLPLRLVITSRTSRPLPIGRAHYREDATLQLVSTSPRR
jgi:hypothetical protein